MQKTSLTHPNEPYNQPLEPTTPLSSHRLLAQTLRRTRGFHPAQWLAVQRRVIRTKGQRMENEKPTLTEKQAYIAMFNFLDQYYERGKSDEIAGLLGSMSFTKSGIPADRAYLDDWKKTVEFALNGGQPPTLKFLE
jgi:hypothetical protein